MATLEAMIGPDLLGEDDGGTTAEEAEAQETMEDSASACGTPAPPSDQRPRTGRGRGFPSMT